MQQHTPENNSGKTAAQTYAERMAKARESVEAATRAAANLPPSAFSIFRDITLPSPAVEVEPEVKKPDSYPPEIWSSRTLLRPLARKVISFAEHNGIPTTQSAYEESVQKYCNRTAIGLLKALQKELIATAKGKPVTLRGRKTPCTENELRLCTAVIDAAGALASELSGEKPRVSFILAMLTKHPLIQGVSNPSLGGIAGLMRGTLFRSRAKKIDWSARLWGGDTQEFARVLKKHKDPNSGAQFSIVRDLQRVLLTCPGEILSTDRIISAIKEETGRSYTSPRISAALKVLALVGHLERHLPERASGKPKRILSTWSVKNCKYRKPDPLLNPRTALLQHLSRTPARLADFSNYNGRVGTLGINQTVVEEAAFHLRDVGLAVITSSGRGLPRMIHLTLAASRILDPWRATETDQLMDSSIYTPVRETLLLGKHLAEVR